VAVAQQARATQEITSSVQSVTRHASQANTDMQEVSRVVLVADTASRSVASAAATVTGTATALQAQVSDFLVSVGGGGQRRSV
jgi:methyl-accepting chemotaxis protein